MSRQTSKEKISFLSIVLSTAGRNKEKKEMPLKTVRERGDKKNTGWTMQMPFQATNVPFQQEQRKSRQHGVQEQASGCVCGRGGGNEGQGVTVCLEISCGMVVCKW